MSSKEKKECNSNASLRAITGPVSFLSQKGFRCDSILGEGYYSVVGLFDKEGYKYALKVIDINKLVLKAQIYSSTLEEAQKKVRDDINKEIYNINKIRNNLSVCGRYGDFLLEYDYLQDPNKKFIYFVSEPMTSELFDFFFSKCIYEDCPQFKIPDLSENRNELAAAVMCQLFYALRCLHKIGIVHGDLKPENILINGETGQIKLADFGGSGSLTRSDPILLQKISVVSDSYLSPEQVKNNRDFKQLLKIDPSAEFLPLKTDPGFDTWALGMIILSLVTGVNGIKINTENQEVINDDFIEIGTDNSGQKCTSTKCIIH